MVQGLSPWTWKANYLSSNLVPSGLLLGKANGLAYLKLSFFSVNKSNYVNTS